MNRGCFRRDTADGDFKDLPKGKASNKALCHKPFNIAKNSQCDGSHRGFASVVCKNVW